MKKVLSLFMSVVMLLTVTAGINLTVSAETFTFGDYKYIVNDEGTAEITDYTGTEANLSIPEKFGDYTVTGINYGFLNCQTLINLSIPKTITSIRDGVFEECSELVCINVDSNNLFYSSEDGILFDKNITKLIQYPSGKNDESYTVPKSVTGINNDAFAWNELTSIIISDSVTSIGSDAFCGSRNLTNINIGNSVTSIGIGAFQFCDELTDVYYNDSISQWNLINFGWFNEDLINATIHCTDGVINEKEQPSEPSTEPTTQPTTQPTTVPTVITTQTTTITQAPIVTTTQDLTTTTTAVTLPRGTQLVKGEIIAPKQKNTKVASAKGTKKSATVKWKKTSGVSGYQVQYSTSKKYTKKTTKSQTIKKNKTTKTTLKKLKSKKTYFVRIRTYKNVKVNGKTIRVYSKWSKTKSVKVK